MTFAILSSITGAFNNVWNRKLKQVDYTTIMFWHGSFGTIAVIALVLIEGAVRSSFRFYTAYQYFIILSAVALDLVAVNSITIAY